MLRDHQPGKRTPILKGDKLTPCLLGGEVSVCGKSGSSPRHQQPLGPSGTLHRMKEKKKIANLLVRQGGRVHFAGTAALEQGITAEGQPEFPTRPRGRFQKTQTLRSQGTWSYLAPG